MVSFVEDCTEGLGRYIQSKFDRLEYNKLVKKGISLGIHTEKDPPLGDYAVSGQWKGVDFTVAFSNPRPSELEFLYMLKVPRGIKGFSSLSHKKDITKFLGKIDTHSEEGNGTYSFCVISCTINKSPDNIGPLQNLFEDLWVNVIRDPLGKAVGLRQ